MNKGLLTFITSIGLLHSVSSSAQTQCVVASTDFDTNSELCCPILTSDNKVGGWYDEDLDWTKLCKTDMFIGPEYARQNGIGGVFSSDANNDMTDIDDVFHLNNLQADGKKTQYGYSTVTAQPKLIHSFCKANEDPNNMYVNIGSAPLCPIVSYTVYGLAPGTTAELSFTLYNLLDPTYFDHLATNVCKGTGAKVPQMGDFITKYNYSNAGVINGNALGFGVVSSDDNVEFNTSYNNALQLTNSKNATTTTAGYGKSTKVTHKAKVPATGNVTFYFYRTSDCFQIPIGIDDIKVTGDVMPVISSTGNPCPEQPLRVTTKQNYPDGTKFSWKESVTGQSSSESSFNFIPEKAETDYSVTLEVTLPGCKASKSEVLKVHSGTCCTSADGAPMAMTNLFFDDFGNFPSDDTYEWTDRFGTTHTEKIPAGQVHTSQSHGGDLKIPYVKAYNIESSGATLAVPVAGSVPNKTELYNHGVYVVSKYGGYPGGVPYDNSGTQTGGMLQFDLLDDGSQDDFFEIDIEHICTGKDITFGADFASISNHAGSIEVKLEYKGKTLVSETKDFSGGSDGWKGVNKNFTIKSEDVGGVDEVTITMKVKHNDVVFGETRDYAIDNIIFQVCTPPDVNVESSVSTGKDILDLCTEDVLTLTSVTSDAVKRFYLYTGNQIDPTKKVGYVYQYTFQDPSTESDKNPITWNTLHKEEVVETESFDVEVEKYWEDIFSHLENDPKHEKRIYFRVVVGEYSDLIADQSWKTNSAFSPCRKISISTIPVVAGLNCAACSPLDFEKTGVTFTADNGKFDAKKNIVELCAGESVELGIKDAVHGLDKDGNDYNDYDVKWFKEDVKSTALKTKKCTTGDDAAPTLTVDYADVESAGTSGVKYIISFHDYFDPTAPTTSCDMTDTITVIANPKPDKTLDNPDPFCEGTLDKEPGKSISGFTMDWYEDADTTNGIDEPVIGGLKKDDSPKSYYYVLTDETTGCRGEANEYVVEVNKAEANTVDNTKKIEYKKTDAKGGSLKPLDQQSGTTFKSALSVKDHTLMVGLVEGATDATAPDLATAKFGAASPTIPTPTVKDVDSSDDEYLWYYTYLESKDGCLSDTVLVGVVIKGAPSPTPKDAAYCVNSKVARPMSEYATPAAEDPNGKLKFYGTDKTTPMSETDLPDVSKPGKYTYWVSQESSTGGGESSKQPIVIEVYGVNDVELAEADHKYCKGETATPLEEIATARTSSDQYVQNTGWEFFEANEPALNEQAAGAETAMAVKTTTAGEYKYYARLKYEVPNSTEVCYGKHVEYTVEVQSVADPTTGTVTYLKDEGKSGFKKPTVQTPDAIQGDASCADCSIVWYRSEDNTTKIDESDATPVYDPNLQGNEEHTYYVKQVNKLGCESNFKPVTIIVSGYPTPTVKNMSVCEGSAKLTGDLKAEANAVSGGASASDFNLVWYNSKADGTIDESKEYDKIELSPSIQKAESGSKETTYKYYVLQRLASSTTKPYAQSAPVPVTVTVNANPKLKEVSTAPKCKGESQKLSEMYDIDIEGCDATYYDANQGSMVTMPSDVVTEGGLYEVKGWYVINKGTPEEETCSSVPEDLTVVFHELDAEIVGSDRTCPGVSVDLDADVKVGGGLNKGDVHYSWSNDLNTESGDKESYNTGADGLDAAGDRMKVTLEVSSDACKGARAVKKSHLITVGDGPLVGNILFSEANNTETNEKKVSDSNIEFRSCGGKVEVKLTGIANKDNTTGYELSGSSTERGTFSSETDGEATLTLGEGRYTLSYINECPTKFEFEISDFSNTANSTNTNMTICERENWSAEITGITGPKPTIEWQRDGDAIPGETNAKLQLSPAKPEDSGVYTYTLFSAGCRFDGKIALGSALKVKPYVVLNENSYEKRYEVVNGNPQTVSLEFKVPATASDIESDVRWSDMNSGFSHSGASVTIDPVDTDYSLHIVAENKDYCKAETDIVILVDAKLKMTAELERTEICEGETTMLTVDTAGTGRVLHPELFTLKVTETTADGDRTVKLTPNRSTGRLEAEVSPVHDAKYTVTYTYGVGGQDESKALDLTVHEKFQVELSAADPVCEGDAVSVEVLKLLPVNTDLDWSDNPADEIVSGSISGATFTPIHTGSGVARQTKTYKVIAKNGICQDKPFMFNVYVDKPIEGEIRTADRICQFDELTLDASAYQAETYEWKYEEKDSVFTGVTAKLVPDPDYATFTLDMTRGKCSAEVQKYVEVTSAPSVLQVDSIGIRQIEIQMEVGLGTGEFKYIIDGNEDDPEIGNNIRDGLSYSEHVVKVIDEVGCSTEFRFVVNNPAIEIPNHISPNEDGVSDKFVVKGLAEGYPDAKVTIFDRWGKQLASYNAGDGTDWDGVYNGILMPSTDYWYEIQIKEIKKTYTGHFTLIRQ